VRRLFARLHDAYRAQGLWLPLVAARWLLRPEYLVSVRDLERGTPTFAVRDDVRWAPLGEADLPALVALSPTLTEADVRRMWAEGQECHTCWIDDVLVFYRWDSTEPAYLPYLDRTFLPRPGDLLVGQLYTHPAYRSQGVSSASSALVMPRLRARGARRSVTLIAWWNRAGIHVTRDKYGHRVVGTIGSWRLGPWRRYFATGDVRLVGRTGFRVEEPPGE
jgi:GNAT superfamily N-acetyltransferase